MVKTVTKELVKQLKKPARQAVTFWSQPVFRDRLFIGFVITAGLLCAVSIFLLMANVRPKDFVVPVRYSTLQGFDELGSWYRVYSFGLFSLLVTVGNSYLAAQSYRRSRMLSFFLIFGAVMINLLTLVVVITLTSNLDI